MPAPTRTLVQKLAEDVRSGRLDAAEEVKRAMAGDDAESVATYALAAAVAGQPLPAESVLDAVVLLDDLQLGALVTAHVTGDRVTALLDAVEKDGTSDERDAVALFLAATLGQEKAPSRLRGLVRTHARRNTSAACGEMLVAAAAALGDEDVRDVVSAVYGDITLRRAEDAVAGLRTAMKDPILDALPDYAPTSLAAPIPLRKAGERPGRNDPCHCGSGKKYKKCCQDKDTASTADPELAWRQQLTTAAPSMSAQQVVDLRLADLASLPFEALSADGRTAAFRELLTHRRWGVAERVLEAMRAKSEDAEAHALDLVDEAFRARALDVARKHAALLGDKAAGDSRVKAMLAASTASAEALASLDHLIEAALREGGPGLPDVADALLAYHPAFGILAARGALVTSGAQDAAIFLELIEEARDRLGLPPGDVGRDVYEALDKLDRDREKAPADREVLEELTIEVRALRARGQEASARIQELEGRLREQRRGDAAPPPSPGRVGERA